MKKVIFLTGGTGLVGSNLIARILQENPTNELVLLVRAQSEVEAKMRIKKALSVAAPELNVEAEQHRIRAVCGDVSLERMGLPEDVHEQLANEVTHIIHSAASVKFNNSLELLRAINVGGTKNVMEFAKQAKQHGQLQRVAHVSTAYVAGLTKGTIYENETLLPEAFSNSYEQAKYEAELYVRSLVGELTVTVFRPSIIVGDSKTGRTTSFNALYAPLKLMNRGLFSVFPGSRSTRMDVVPIDYVCDAITHIFFGVNNIAGKTFHLSAGEENAPTVGRIVDCAHSFFQQHTSNQTVKGVLFIPVWVYRAAKNFLGRQLKRIADVMDVFLPYVHVERVFDNSNTLEALKGSGVQVPAFESYFETILLFSLETNWGKRLS